MSMKRVEAIAPTSGEPGLTTSFIHTQPAGSSYTLPETMAALSSAPQERGGLKVTEGFPEAPG